MLSRCLFNLYAEYIVRNAGLEETQAGIKIPRRNINKLRYEITPPLWQKEKSEKTGLKPNIQKTKIMASGPITSWQIDGENMKTVINFIFFELQNHCGQWLQ